MSELVSRIVGTALQWLIVLAFSAIVVSIPICIIWTVLHFIFKYW